MKQLRPYRPSNGTEGDVFMQQYCYRCAKDNPDNEVYCHILGATMAFDLSDEGYPKDTWVYFNDDPTCLAFKDRDDDNGENGRAPIPFDDPRQLDLFVGLPVVEAA